MTYRHLVYYSKYSPQGHTRMTEESLLIWAEWDRPISRLSWKWFRLNLHKDPHHICLFIYLVCTIVSVFISVVLNRTYLASGVCPYCILLTVYNSKVNCHCNVHQCGSHLHCKEGTSCVSTTSATDSG